MTWQDLRDQVVYPREAYDKIANMGSAISGIDLANVDFGQTWIRYVQDRLADPNANYSLSQERYNYAHSDFTYGLIANNANRIFGYDWGANADNVRWAQGLLAGGESMQGVLNSFAYGGETYGLIAAMNASILGYAVSDATIRQQQAQLANGASFNDLENKLLNR